MGTADIALRHIVRRHPEALVSALDVEEHVEIVGWLDTQVTALERRLDKALGLRINGEMRALHVEFEYELRDSIGSRLREYQTLFEIGRTGVVPEEGATPIESMVVVLTGRKRPWPADGKHRTGWPERRKWSGFHYRIDAVYQRTVEELRARGSVLWLVFVPLVRDATLEAVRSAIEELQARVPDREELGDLLAALLVMADVDPWGYHWRPEIAAMIESSVDLMDVSKTLRDAFEKGIEKGIEKGRREAIEDMLRRLFVRRLGRPLTAPERQALAARVAQNGESAELAEDRALSLEGEALAAWLLDPKAR